MKQKLLLSWVTDIDKSNNIVAAGFTSDSDLNGDTTAGGTARGLITYYRAT